MPCLRDLITRFHFLPALRACPRLASLGCWGVVRRALSEQATADWGEAWDAGQAQGGGGAWQAHCVCGERMEAFRLWLAARAEKRVAVVSHWGAINNLLNREPWADARRRFGVGRDWFPESWHPEGLAQMFALPNAGWVALEYEYQCHPGLGLGEGGGGGAGPGSDSEE